MYSVAFIEGMEANFWRICEHKNRVKGKGKVVPVLN
jgi:hypothetical protein